MCYITAGSAVGNIRSVADEISDGPKAQRRGDGYRVVGCGVCGVSSSPVLGLEVEKCVPEPTGAEAIAVFGECASMCWIFYRLVRGCFFC